jgi:hypothetical protein
MVIIGGLLHRHPYAGQPLDRAAADDAGGDEAQRVAMGGLEWPLGVRKAEDLMSRLSARMLQAAEGGKRLHGSRDSAAWLKHCKH